jgi:chorismate synthase
VVRVAIKPTPSIAREQDTVSLSGKCPAKLSVKGRHDPCIAQRAVPVVEAVTAAVMLDMLIGG